MATRAVSLNEEFGRSFEQEWPELARCLDRFLAAKGVDPWQRADVIQETATRLYGRWPRLDHSRPLWNLVVTIALRVLIDEHRRAARLELVSETPQPEADDVEERALNRVHLTRAHAALKKLRPNQRQVLLAEVGEAAALEGPRNRINVLRLRARLALKNELGPWAPAGVAMRVRSLRSAFERRLAEWGQDNQGVAASIASIVVAATLTIAGPAAGDPEPIPANPLPKHVALAAMPVANLDAALVALERRQAPSLSGMKDQLKKKAPPPQLCAVVCTEPKGPVKDNLDEGVKQTDNALKKADDGLSEGDRQLRRGERKVRRVVTDPPLP